MQERLFANPKIEVVYDSVVEEVLGGGEPAGVTGVRIRNLKTNEARDLKVDGLFVAIGHDPATQLFKGKLPLDNEGYILTAARQHGDLRPRRVRGRRREGQDIPPGGDRRRHGLHGGAGSRQVPGQEREPFFRGGGRIA